jgi:predicted dehydrogenase
MFYRDVADHLLEGAPVPISGECGRRVIGVLETAKKSAETGRSEEVPYK